MIKKKITEHEAGQLIRTFVQTEMKLSQRSLKKLKATPGGIQVNGVEKTVRYMLQQGDMLSLHFPDEREETSIIPEEVPITIVYEDEAMIVLEKQAGMATIPSHHHPTRTIANGLLYYYEKHALPYTVHVVTRLDRDTSGLMLIAKHRHAHHLLSEQLQVGKIIRKYRAIVHGIMNQPKGTINAPIGRKAGSMIERTVTINGQPAITHYEVIEQIGAYSVVDVLLETGRTHQVRVHFAFIGHPLVGDELYGGSTKVLARQALHACTLFLYHPMTNEPLEFRSALPQELAVVVQSPNE